MVRSFNKLGPYVLNRHNKPQRNMMKKLRETVRTMLRAAQYSFSFCWRNNKRETVIVILVAVLNTVLVYLNIQAIGAVVNAVQTLLERGVGTASTIWDLLDLGLRGPLVFLAIVLVADVVLGRMSWFFRRKWQHELRFANLREINEHRALLDVATFRSKKYDDLLKRIQELQSGWYTRVAFSEETLGLFMSTISFLLFGASLLLVSPWYAVILAVSAVPMIVYEFYSAGRFWDLYLKLVPHHKARSVLERAYHNTNTFVQGLMFNQMGPLRKKIDANTGVVLTEYRKIRTHAFYVEHVTYLIMYIGFGVVVVHAATSTILSAGLIGAFTVVLASAKTFQNNLEQIFSLIAEQLNSAKGVVLIEEEVLKLEPLIKTERPIVPEFNGPPEIRIENVGFSYPDTNKEVLFDINLTIAPGSKVAIVGKSGNGKSTLQALLMRHYDPTSGRILANGVDLRRIRPYDWNRVASALTQEYTVLERLVGEEIASSRLDSPYDPEAVHRSARFADFIDVVADDKDGFNSQIGIEFGGRDFSGGEKQRLALARVHYRNTPILILDEPDAKLDPESAQRVIDEVMALEGVTVIMITHHVSRAEKCDHVVVMGRGRIVEQGTHENLMSLNGTYASLWTKDRERLGAEV